MAQSTDSPVPCQRVSMPKKTNPIQYKVVIPERDEILDRLKRSRAPLQLDDIAKTFDLATADERAALNKRLRAMLRDGQVIRNRRQGYGLLKKMDLIAGRVIGNADGYGFLRPDKGGDDLYLSMKQMRTVLHGDHVVVRPAGFDRHGRQEAVIVEVLERVNQTIVGRFFLEDNIGFVVPDNKRISQDVFIPSRQQKMARAGEYVVADITRQPAPHTQPVGRIIEVLGRSSSVQMAVDIAVRAYGIPHEWPEELEDELGELKPRADKNRTDLRALPLITIDGEDTQDFDDAVYCERQGSGWRLIVAIADVSHYVKKDSVLDKTAMARGNSVYFPRRVLPMLPELLSNDLCSLIPGQERLAMICELDVNRAGRIKHYRLYPATIKSNARLTYTLVAAILDGEKVDKKYDAIIPLVNDLFELYAIMHRHRERQGILDFSSAEVQLHFDEAGKITNIDSIKRHDSHRLIEEFMLAANVAAAEFLLTNDTPTVFRNHGSPGDEKINDLNQFLADFDLQLGGGLNPQTKDYAEIIRQIATREDKHLIETVLLRSMPLAVYEGRNKGHFGLSFKHYTHFTSPIRRYADLLVHRAIKHVLAQGDYDYTRGDMHNYGVHCSMTERRATEATRDVVARMKCEFMLDKTGSEYNGIISAVTGFGLFVELDDMHTEGLIHISALPTDYYHFDPIAHSLSGERSGRRYFPGEKIRVRLANVNVDERKIDLDYVTS